MGRVLNERGIRVFNYHYRRWRCAPGDNPNVTLGQRQYSKAYTDGMESALEGDFDYIGRKDWQRTELQKTAFKRGMDFVNSGRGGEVYNEKKHLGEIREYDRIRDKSLERHKNKNKRKEGKRK